MKKWLSFASLLVLLTSFTALAQSCDQVVTADEAGILGKAPETTRAAADLQNLGVDVHIITIADISKYGRSILDAENHYESVCPAWAPGGKRKANLMTILVAPTARKKNMFIGSNYSQAFESPAKVDLLYSQASNTQFGGKQWDAGFASAERAFALKIKNFLTPPEEHYNLTWFYALLAILSLVGVVWFVYFLRKKKQEESLQISQAKSRAVAARASATRAFRGIDSTYPKYESLSSRFLDLSNSVSFDIDSEERSVAEYEKIHDAWDEFRNDIYRADVRNRVASSTDKFKTTSTGRYSSTTKSHSNPPKPADIYSSRSEVLERGSTPSGYPRTYTPPPAPVPPPPPPPSPVHHHHHHTTIVERDSSSDFLSGMIVGEELSRPEPRSYEPPTRSSSPSWFGSDDSSSSSSSSSGGGGSDSLFSAVADTMSDICSGGDDSGF